MSTAADFASALPRGIGSIALDRMYPPSDPHIDDPAGWMHEKLGRCLWSKQVEILESVRDNPRTAVKACHGPGKSFSGSGAGTWWNDVHDLGSSFLITTAPSWHQVEAILWREIKRRHREGNLRGRITMDCKWHMGEVGTKRADRSEELIGMGRKPADYDEDTFQGIHARYLLALLDEACGIPEQLWVAILALMTNERSRVLALGNPDDPNSHFAKLFRPGSGWNTISISVWDTPNFTGEDTCAVCGKPLPEEVLESLVSQAWVDQARREWGEGSPLWVSKVEAEFPDVSDAYLISPALVEKAWRTDLAGLEDGRYGVDIARKGTGKSVMYRNRGGVIRKVLEWAKEDTMQSAGRIARQLRGHGIKRIPANIDIIGVGAGVYDRLREQRLNVAPFQGSERAINPAKYKNRVSEAWWHFRGMMEEGLIDLDPDDEALAGQLTARMWGIDSTGRIWIEPKEDMEERGVPSPDHADAAVMSTVSAGSVAGHAQAESSSNSVTGDLLKKVI